MDAEITIIGAGVVGLAIAQKLSADFRDVFVVEKHLTFGQETSSRNSEVIHAGLYYPEGSLKSRLCVEGKKLLYDFCKEHEVPYKNCGKLVVATTSDEIQIIEGIQKTALKNGVGDLVILDRKDVAELEPDVFALAALHSPSTGIVDTHLLMKSYETITVNNGGQIAYGNEVTGIKRIADGYEITLSSPGDDKYTFTSRVVINSGGLTSDRISEMAGLHDDKLKITFCKGEYFRLKPPKNRLINRLVYPVPVHNLEGIGIHVTIEMDGGVKLGPDVTYLESNIYDYKVDPSKQEAFYRSVSKFLPFIGFDDLMPEMAGIRPKIQRPGDPVKDFYIMEESRRGFPGFINLIGIESPGLTASLAVANYVRNLILI
ncbi:MAG: NAD(P)/FAD-dependent oxidoreductase [Bacteroidota bacterium]|nr:NAD(P)/FAD-dependent oxidoreductase [Bacteroidota bacterium]